MSLQSIANSNSRLNRQNQRVGGYLETGSRGADGNSRQKYRGFTIEVTKRNMGVTVRRSVYSVLLKRDKPATQQSHSGFQSATTAIAAGKKKIDLLLEVERNAAQRPPKRPVNKRTIPRREYS